MNFVKAFVFAVCLAFLTMTIFECWSAVRFFAFLLIYTFTILIGEWAFEKN